MKMEKYKILTEFVKDISVETKDIQTYLFVTFLNSNFLVGGKINKKPIISVANPGKIKSKAAKARAAPDIIS